MYDIYMICMYAYIFKDINFIITYKAVKITDRVTVIQFLQPCIYE